MINEQMSCIKCGDKFYIKNSKLFCKKCKFLISPLDVSWTCIICHKEFKSYAKIYNPLEYKLIKLAIRNAKLNKKITKPKEVPCGCFSKDEIDNITFRHKLYGKCNGVLYYGTISGKDIVVCSLCKIMGSLNNFNLYCLICGKNFITKNVKIYSIDNYNNKNISKNKLNNNNIDIVKYDNSNNITYNNTNSNTNNSNFNNTSPLISKKNSNNFNLNDYNKNTNNSRNSNDIYNLRAFNNNNEENGIIKLHQKLIGNTNIDITSNKRRNLSISLMNKQFSKTKATLKTSNNTRNYDNTIDNLEDENENNTDNIIKHPKKKINYLSVSKNNLLNNSIQSWRPIYENIIDRNKSNDSYKNINNKNTNNKNYQICVPKRTINLFTKSETESNNITRKTSSNDRNSENVNINNNTNNYYDFNFDNPNNKSININNKGLNRFKLNYYSPSTERKNLQIKFNEDEIENRERIKELKRKNLQIESPIINLNDRYSNKLSPYSNYNDKIDFENEFFKKDYMNYKEISKLRNSLSNNRYFQNERLTNSFLSKSPLNERGKFENYNLLTEKNPLINSEIILNRNNDLSEKIENNEEDELKSFDYNEYTIITQLGKETFGKIYLVKDKNEDLFSMKKIILSEELDIEDIIKEYKLCHKLKHDNIVKILGLCKTKLDSTTFIIYILMEVGLNDWEKEIKNYIEKKINYSEEDLINIIKQLINALSFLQSKNVSHRDIKPHNVLIFKDKIYKIADFGEAKQISKINQNQQINTLRGTELYMSPLLFNGLRTNQIDIKHNLFKSDVYSLGLCILYAATLNIDFIYEIRKYVDFDEVKKFIFDILNENYSQNFIQVVQKMLEINEKFRPDFIELEDIVNNML